MIKIDGKEIRTESEQVWKNMEDIDKLQEAIKPEYTTDAVLTDTSVSVALTDTNAPAGTTKGWLLSHDGLKFKITGGDDTNLLLEFYANLKGPQGEDGAAVNIDDSTVSPTKVWSSQKTYFETQIGNDKGIFYTTVAPIFFSGTSYDFDLDDVANATSTKKPKIKDLVIYIDNGVPSTVFEVIDEGGGPTLKLVGTYSQGKQLYQHNVYFKQVGTNSTIYFQFQLNNNISTPMTFNEFREYIYENRVMGWGGTSLTNLNSQFTSHPYGSTTKSYNIYSGSYYSTGGSILTDLTTKPSNYTLEDDVKPL